MVEFLHLENGAPNHGRHFDVTEIVDLGTVHAFDKSAPEIYAMFVDEKVAKASYLAQEQLAGQGTAFGRPSAARFASKHARVLQQDPPMEKEVGNEAMIEGVGSKAVIATPDKKTTIREEASRSWRRQSGSTGSEASAGGIDLVSAVLWRLLQVPIRQSLEHGIVCVRRPMLRPRQKGSTQPAACT
ncbi:unnamed protein product, partial [Polarella glacialis]